MFKNARTYPGQDHQLHGCIKTLLSDYAVQAQYHGEIARSMMISSVQTSSSSDDRADIMEVLCQVYYTLGRALTQLKK